MSPSQEASLGSKIRSKLDGNGFGDILLIAHDNNFFRLDEAIDALSENPKTFDGVAFHAYSGTLDAMEQFREQTENQDNWLTEFSTQVRDTTTAWDSMFYFLDSIFLPAANYYSRSVSFHSFLLAREQQVRSWSYEADDRFILEAFTFFVCASLTNLYLPPSFFLLRSLRSFFGTLLSIKASDQDCHR